jgi:hypothetical protein
LLQHGYSSCAGTFLYGPPDKSLAYVLSTAGYDVWLGNVRGNRYSRHHEVYDPGKEEEINQILALFYTNK